MILRIVVANFFFAVCQILQKVYYMYYLMLTVTLYDRCYYSLYFT